MPPACSHLAVRNDVIRFFRGSGRLHEKGHGISQYYRIGTALDETGNTVIGLTWERLPVAGSRLTPNDNIILRHIKTDMTIVVVAFSGRAYRNTVHQGF
jgi:hypothetical protein